MKLYRAHTTTARIFTYKIMMEKLVITQVHAFMLRIVTVILNTITSESSVRSMSSYPDKILTTIKINYKRNIQMKVDIEADICVLTTDNLQKLGLFLGIKLCCSILKGCGGNPINNLGATNLRATFKDKLISTKVNIVEASGHPSMIGCQQVQELGTIIVNIKSFPVHNCNPQQNRLSTKVVCPKLLC